MPPRAKNLLRQLIKALSARDGLRYEDGDFDAYYDYAVANHNWSIYMTENLFGSARIYQNVFGRPPPFTNNQHVRQARFMVAQLDADQADANPVILNILQIAQDIMANGLRGAQPVDGADGQPAGGQFEIENELAVQNLPDNDDVRQPDFAFQVPQDMDASINQPVAQPWIVDDVGESSTVLTLPADVRERMRVANVDQGVLLGERKVEDEFKVPVRRSNRTVSVARRISVLHAALSRIIGNTDLSTGQVFARIINRSGISRTDVSRISRLAPVIRSEIRQLQMRPDITTEDGLEIDSLVASVIDADPDMTIETMGWVPFYIASLLLGSQRSASSIGGGGVPSAAILAGLSAILMSGSDPNSDELDNMIQESNDGSDYDAGDGGDAPQQGAPPHRIRQRLTPNMIAALAAYFGAPYAGQLANLIAGGMDAAAAVARWAKENSIDVGAKWIDKIIGSVTFVTEMPEDYEKDDTKDSDLSKDSSKTDSSKTDSSKDSSKTRTGDIDRFVNKSSTDRLANQTRTEFNRPPDDDTDVRVVRNADTEPIVKQLRPTFFELGTNADTETPQQALTERIQFAMFPHVVSGHGNGAANPIHKMNKIDEQKRFSDTYPSNYNAMYSTPEVTEYTTLNTDGNLVRFIPPQQLAYFSTDAGKTKQFNLPNMGKNSMLLQDIHNNAAYLNDANGLSGVTMNIPLTNLVPSGRFVNGRPVSNFREFYQSNYVTDPPEGTTKDHMPMSLRRDVVMPEMYASGRSFPVGYWRTGVSPYSY